MSAVVRKHQNFDRIAEIVVIELMVLDAVKLYRGGGRRHHEIERAVGDTTLTDLIAKLPVIFGGLGLAALGAKVNDASPPAPQTAKSSKAK